MRSTSVHLLIKKSEKKEETLGQELLKIREKWIQHEATIDDLKKNNHEEDLMQKNVKWAQENNELRSELVKIEQTAIEGKVIIANLASLNDQLKHVIQEKNKEITRWNYYIKKYKIDLPKRTKEQKDQVTD